ncbi:MAG: malic enzyme [Bradymonadia bacterium]|jgi:malic enzyme
MTWRESGSRVFVVDADGLTLTSDEASAEERRVATPPAAISGWSFEGNRPSLVETIECSGATALIGLSGQAYAFTREVVQAMCASVSRPVILPFSWPEGRNEGRWEDIAAWSSGAAIVAGVEASPDESGCPEAWLIPGMTIGCVIADAAIIDDGMVMAAALAMYRTMSAEDDHLIPSASALPDVTQSVALEVVRASMRSGTAMNTNLDFGDVERYVRRRMSGETDELGGRSQDHGWEERNRR